MIFNMITEEPNMKNFKSINRREAVRAIIISDDTILLVQSNKGDYKFPGGGVEENESHAEGLMREVREETGYTACVVKDKVGTFVERNVDEYEHDSLFEMSSHYYLCELANEERVAQQLDEYESLLDFTAKWVTLDEAIRQNEHLLNECEKNSWLKREAFVLKELKLTANQKGE